MEALVRVHADEWEIASFQVSIARMAALLGRPELAETEATSALAAGRRLNSPGITAHALYARAVACSQSDPDAASAALDEYLRIVDTERTDPVGFALARCLALAAQLHAAAGQLPRALGELRDAIETADVDSDRPAMAYTLARAVVILRSDDPNTAAVLCGVIGEGVLGRQFPVLIWERDWFHRITDELATVLGPDRYQAAIDHGVALPYEDAVGTALDAIAVLTPSFTTTRSVGHVRSASPRVRNSHDPPTTALIRQPRQGRPGSHRETPSPNDSSC
jgi:hypothetical protein